MGQVVLTFDSVGSHPITGLPDGVSAQLECWSAGGNGGNRSGFPTFSNGGGGGGGAYSRVNAHVIDSARTYVAVVGASAFETTVTENGVEICRANGGSAGGSNGSAGAGGLAGGLAVGDVLHAGGDGATGASGGGAGGSAGPSGAGNSASGGTGGAAVSGGGAGGNGGNPPTAGSAPGGGGGGATSGPGAAGAIGKVVVTYDVASFVPDNPNVCRLPLMSPALPMPPVNPDLSLRPMSPTLALPPEGR